MSLQVTKRITNICLEHQENNNTYKGAIQNERLKSAS